MVFLLLSGHLYYSPGTPLILLRSKDLKPIAKYIRSSIRLEEGLGMRRLEMVIPGDQKDPRKKRFWWVYFISWESCLGEAIASSSMYRQTYT